MFGLKDMPYLGHYSKTRFEYTTLQPSIKWCHHCFEENMQDQVAILVRHGKLLLQDQDGIKGFMGKFHISVIRIP